MLLAIEDETAASELRMGLSMLATGKVNGVKDEEARSLGADLLWRASGKVTVLGGGILE